MDPEDLDPVTLLLLLAGHVRERVVTHPFSTLGGAAAVGYVLGFGLPGVLLRTGGAMALRAASLLIIEEVLRPAVEETERGATGGSSNGRVSPDATMGATDRDVDPYVA